jgi:hypothetical protein
LPTEHDPKTTFRAAVYKTTLGVRAKLILIALADVGAMVDHSSLLIPSDAFLRVAPMVTRTAVRVVRTVKALETAKVVRIEPEALGWHLAFHPENERHYAEEGKKGRRA